MQSFEKLSLQINEGVRRSRASSVYLSRQSAVPKLVSVSDRKYLTGTTSVRTSTLSVTPTITPQRGNPHPASSTWRTLRSGGTSIGISSIIGGMALRRSGHADQESGAVGALRRRVQGCRAAEAAPTPNF